MTGSGRTGELSMALFMVGVVAFSPPLLFIFGTPEATLFGIPLLYVYLFAVWIGLIGLGAVVAERARSQPLGGRDGQQGDDRAPPEPPRA